MVNKTVLIFYILLITVIITVCTVFMIFVSPSYGKAIKCSETLIPKLDYSTEKTLTKFGSNIAQRWVPLQKNLSKQDIPDREH